MINAVIMRRVTQIGIAAAMVGATVYLLNTVAEQGVWGLAAVLIWILPLLWIVFGGARWWMLMPLAVAFGGTFILEHKLFTHEIALPICVLALLPLLASRRQEKIAREPMTSALWLLLALFIMNLIRSLLLSQWEGLGGGGSISRAYFHGLWAILFLIVFYLYGSTRSVKWLLILLYSTYLLRALAGVISFLVGQQVQIPYLNFVVGGGGFADLRFTGIQLVLIAFACFQYIPSRWGKVMNLGVIGLSVWLVLIGGGRASLGMMCVIPVAWAVIRRRYGWFSVACGLVVMMVVILNQSPNLIYRFPVEAQRTMSILVGESSTQWLNWHSDVRASNEWHKRLSELGMDRWTESVATIVFGNQIEPFDDLYEAYSATFEDRAHVASRQGLYESGLWTLLSPMGLAGGLLYAYLFWFLLRGPLRVLREEGVCGLAHVFYFLAVLEIVIWSIFCWISGGYPSHELLMAGIAKAVYEDRKRSQPGDLV
ncbi:MAG: hypothetical protein WCI03_09200 [bacterium]|jgi:hypothetical protein